MTPPILYEESGQRCGGVLDLHQGALSTTRLTSDSEPGTATAEPTILCQSGDSYEKSYDLRARCRTGALRGRCVGAGLYRSEPRTF